MCVKNPDINDFNEIKKLKKYALLKLVVLQNKFNKFSNLLLKIEQKLHLVIYNFNVKYLLIIQKHVKSINILNKVSYLKLKYMYRCYLLKNQLKVYLPKRILKILQFFCLENFFGTNFIIKRRKKVTLINSHISTIFKSSRNKRNKSICGEKRYQQQFKNTEFEHLYSSVRKKSSSKRVELIKALIYYKTKYYDKVNLKKKPSYIKRLIKRVCTSKLTFFDIMVITLLTLSLTLFIFLIIDFCETKINNFIKNKIWKVKKVKKEKYIEVDEHDVFLTKKDTPFFLEWKLFLYEELEDEFELEYHNEKDNIFRVEYSENYQYALPIIELLEKQEEILETYTSNDIPLGGFEIELITRYHERLFLIFKKIINYQYENELEYNYLNVDEFKNYLKKKGVKIKHGDYDIDDIKNSKLSSFLTPMDTEFTYLKFNKKKIKCRKLWLHKHRIGYERHYLSYCLRVKSIKKVIF
jgi:hypothetical protein